MTTKKKLDINDYPRSSSFYAYANCPVSFKLSRASGEEPPTPHSDRGSTIHQLISGKLDPETVEPGLQEEALALDKQRITFFDKYLGDTHRIETRETRLWAREGVKPLYSGQPDIWGHAVRNEAVVCLSDYKTGWHPLDEFVATNCQIRSYAGLVYFAYKPIKLVAAIHKPGHQLAPAVFDEPALKDALDWSIRVAKRAIEGKGKPNRGPWCKYCSGKVLCPLWRTEVAELAQFADITAAELPDSQLRSIAPKLALAASVVERLQERLYTRVRERPDFFRDWRFEPGEERRKVTDIVAAYNQMVVKNQYLTPGEFLASCRMAISDIEMRLRKKLALTVKSTQQLIADTLEGIITTKPNKDRLVYDPKAVDEPSGGEEQQV